jgi:hypothetical protein
MIAACSPGERADARLTGIADADENRGVPCLR